MIGQTVSHYNFFQTLPSMEFIPSSSSGRRLNESEGLRTSGEGGKNGFRERYHLNRAVTRSAKMRKVIHILIIVLIASTMSHHSSLAQQIGALEPGGYLISDKLRQVLVNELSGEVAKKHVEELSQYHRIRGGGPGYHGAAIYIQDMLKRYGYTGIELESFLADGYTYYLGWKSLVGSRVEEAELWMLEPKKMLLARASEIAVSLMPYSNASHAVGEVIDVGQGTRSKDYEGIDVRDKIVLANGRGGGVHREAVIKRGALGVLVTPSGRPDRQDYADLLEMHRLTPSGEERSKTTFGFSLSLRQSRLIRQHLAEGKKVTVEATVDAELFDGQMEVLTAVMKGSKYPDQEIILISHLDHYQPNLEIARTLMKLVKTGQIPAPKRTIRIMWVPEFHGTMAYLSKHADFGERGLAAINMDMTGQDQYKTRSLMAYRRPTLSSPSYVGDVVENMLRFVDTADITSPRGSRQLFNYRVGDYSGGSDHVPLTDPSIGVPAVMLGFSPDRFHHTSEDTPDKIDPTSLKRISTVALGSVLFMANAEDEEALRLAGEVSGQALARLGRIAKKNVNDLYQVLLSSGEEEFHRRYKNALAYTRFIGETEKQIVRSTKEFASTDMVGKAVEQIAESLEPHVQAELKQIGDYYYTLCGMHNLKPRSPELTAKEREAQQLVPKRLFRGMMDRSLGIVGAMVAKSKGEVWRSDGTNGTNVKGLEAGFEEDVRWYEENAAKLGGIRTLVRRHLLEIINFMDGKRSVLDIRNAVSAEFGEIDLEFVMKYISDLKRFDLVSY
jgi:hypothetical protein